MKKEGERQTHCTRQHHLSHSPPTQQNSHIGSLQYSLPDQVYTLPSILKPKKGVTSAIYIRSQTLAGCVVHPPVTPEPLPKRLIKVYINPQSRGLSEKPRMFNQPLSPACAPPHLTPSPPSPPAPPSPPLPPCDSKNSNTPATQWPRPPQIYS